MKLLKTILFSLCFLVLGGQIFGQIRGNGKLFIIGGGNRSVALMDKMLQTADLRTGDYVAFLPMASTVPEEGYQYFKKGFGADKSVHVVQLNFTREQAENDMARIDSVRKAKLIYFAGGDQNRLMAVVKDTKLYQAIHEAFENGATIAGTSAGAAVMSKIMLTGEPISTKEFNVIRYSNVQTAEGMGFLTEDIIDQHFIKRSRFNRLISVLAMNPTKQAIGIDESTAIICQKGIATVVGDGQVVLMSNPQGLDSKNQKLVSFKNVDFALLKSGEKFKLKTKN